MIARPTERVRFWRTWLHAKRMAKNSRPRRMEAIRSSCGTCVFSFRRRTRARERPCGAVLRKQREISCWYRTRTSNTIRALTRLSDIATNLKLTDMETCYKVFRREVLAGVQVKSNRFGFEPEITAKIARHKWRIYEVPISYAGGTSEEGKKIT